MKIVLHELRLPRGDGTGVVAGSYHRVPVGVLLGLSLVRGESCRKNR